MEKTHASLSAGKSSLEKSNSECVLVMADMEEQQLQQIPRKMAPSPMPSANQQEQDAHFLQPSLSDTLQDNINDTIQRRALHEYMQSSSIGQDLSLHNSTVNEASSFEMYQDIKQSIDHRQQRIPKAYSTPIDCYTFYSVDRGTLRASSLHDLLHTPLLDTPCKKRLSEELLSTGCWWIDIANPTDSEMRSLSQIFRLHPLTTEDIQAQETREKCEIFQNYMFISFRSFDHDYHSPSYLESVNFYIIVFKDGVLTFRFQPLPHSDNVRQRIHQLKEVIKVTPEWINYALIDNVTDGFAPLIQHAELEVDSIDDLVLVLTNSEQSDMLRRIGSCRKTVMQLHRLLGPKADVLRSLIKRYEDRMQELAHVTRSKPDPSLLSSVKEEARVQHEVILYLGDIQDHILTMLQNVTHFDLTLGRAHRNYLGQISIELSQAGNLTNEVINRLTFLATIAVPLNLVASIFGMNVQVPGQQHQDLVWFFWIIGGMLLFVVMMITVGRRNNLV
ncbi:hypothetical protein BDF14DRAFT_1879052 [Spinellus fusiger]|nr:hypothetical protein BDF14DRAFT_1879052 [Spinellus fusiger]